MRRMMVRYTVRPECVAENERLVRAVYGELDRTAPGGLRYATFRLDGGATFVHIVESDGDTSPLLQTTAFQEFQTGIADRCVDPPQAAALEVVGDYRLFGATTPAG